MTHADDTLRRLEEHPLTKKLREEEAAKTLAQREEAAGRLVDLKKEAEKIVLELQATLAKASGKLTAHDGARKALQDTVTAATATLYSERHRLDREKLAAEVVLLETADPQIDTAIEFFLKRHESLLSKSIDHQTRLGETNIFTMSQKVHVFSNVSAIRAALEYCRAAVTDLESMKLKPILDTARIELLKNSIPDPNELSEAIGDQVYPKAGAESVNPLACLPSDDEFAWSERKLDEKIKKHMSK